jgi:hypothetical protein
MKRTYKLGLIIATVTMGVFGGFLIFVHAAGTASFSLSPATGSHDISTNFNVAVYENSGSEQVNAVTANLNYDAGKLQFVSVSTAGSPFSTCTQSSGGGGNVAVSCASLGGSSTGSHLVATITFKALVGSGTSAVAFAGDSHIVRASDTSDVWNGNTTGGTYTFTTPATGGGGGNTGGGGGGNTTTTNTNTKTNTSSSPKTTNNSAAATPNTAAQQANPSEPVPVAAAANAPNGYLVAIRVTDSKGKLISGAEVTLNNQTVKSDTTGVASFTNVPAGKQAYTIKSSKGSVKGEVTVSDQKSPTDVQEFALKVTSKSTLPLIFKILGVLILLAIIFFIIKRLRGKKEPVIKVNTPPEPGKVTSSAPPGIVVAPGNTPSPSVSPSPPTPAASQMAPTVVVPTEAPQVKL